jgi:hypothetical protein
MAIQRCAPHQRADH